MNIELIASTNGLKDSREMIEFGLKCARVCYTNKNWADIQKEPINKQLLNRLVSSGHHSVFEHMNLTFYFNGMSKALVMLFNNEKQYATSEKSARYTVMSDIEPEQKKLYDKWMEILIPEIDKIYPETKDFSARKIAVKKLAQENARYMTSVFTPTKMVHTINLRQLNFLQQQFERFNKKYRNDDDEFKSRLATEMQDFLSQTENLRIEGLDNQTDRKLSYFSTIDIPSTEGKDTFTEGKGMYSRIYLLSFAGLAQAHRHRTISYNVLSGTEKGAKEGFFVPPIVRESGRESEWIDDLSNVAEKDFPQAQLLKIYERGRIEDFRSKALLRLCGHAQLEIMRNTLETARGYKEYIKTYGKNALKPKCLQGMKCLNNCVWTGKRALERLI